MVYRVSSRENELNKYEMILDVFTRALHELKSPAERKLFLINASETISEVKWWGISILADRILDDLLKEREDALTISLMVRFIVKRFPDKARSLANELILRLNDLTEWEYDKAVSLINIVLAMKDLGEIEAARKYAYEALKWARAIPDRSDRSIVLSRLVPILFDLGEKETAISIIDEIVYSPKKIDALISLAERLRENDDELIELLLRKCPIDEKSLILAIWANSFSPNHPEKVYTICSKVLSSIQGLESIRAVNIMLNCFSALAKLPRSEYRQKALEIHNKLREILLKRLEERPYMNIFFHLLEILIKMGVSEKIQEILTRLENLAAKKRPPENIFLLNRIALIRAKINELENAVRNFSLVLEIAKGIEKLIAIPALIDTAATIFLIMNDFPEDLPENIVWKFVERIRPIEYVEIPARLSRENTEFLKQAYPGRTISEALNSIIHKERISESLELDKKVINIVFQLIDRGEYIILHYVIKYIYSIGISERERISILNMLGRVVEMLRVGRISDAKNYIELIFSRLRRFDLPLTPIVIEFMREYVLATFFSG